MKKVSERILFNKRDWPGDSCCVSGDRRQLTFLAKRCGTLVGICSWERVPSHGKLMCASGEFSREFPSRIRSNEPFPLMGVPHLCTDGQGR